MKIAPVCVSNLNFKSDSNAENNDKTFAKKGHHYASVTGWTAAGAFGVSAIAASMKKFPLHKIAAAAGFIFGAAHIAEIYINRSIMKKSQNIADQK